MDISIFKNKLNMHIAIAITNIESIDNIYTDTNLNDRSSVYVLIKKIINKWWMWILRE